MWFKIWSSYGFVLIVLIDVKSIMRCTVAKKFENTLTQLMSIGVGLFINALLTGLGVRVSQ